MLLLVKTTGAKLAALELRIKALHHYEVPEIIALPIVGGSAGYLAWLARESAEEPPRGSESGTPA